jgi:uncharacterized protein YceK
MRIAIKNLLTVTLVTCLLSGCAGISVSQGSKRDEQALVNQSSFTLKNGSVLQWDKTPHPIDGNLVVESDTNWCGLTVWAIIPLPMLLPVCKSYTEVSFSKNLATTKIRNEQQTFFALCGPALWMLSSSESRKGGHFCEAGTL